MQKVISIQSNYSELFNKIVINNLNYLFENKAIRKEKEEKYKKEGVGKLKGKG